ncbi:MAG: hypothetical protein HYV45_01495 [Candidatus Moranbacteria bacterium]|nr:hypothetical protein [Candidatus Moranbacteria bacterium]
MDTLFAPLGDFFSAMGSMFSVVLSVWFILFPPILFFVFKVLWVPYVQGRYASKIKWILLEIIPPRDIEKSPLPMESIFSGFAGVIKTPTTAEEWIGGEFPVSFSLEIASHEGEVHFYIRTQAGFRDLVEAQFYAHYPNVEIVEVPDYITRLPKTIPNKGWELWGADLALTKDDLYPIKTYKYFEESVTGKMIDPLASLVETMGKAGPGQFMWLQMITTPIKESWAKEHGQPVVDTFLGRVKEEKMGIFARLLLDIKDILLNLHTALLGKEVVYSTGASDEKKDEQPVEFRLTPGEKDVLKALQSQMGKQQFKMRMRYVYTARRDIFSKTFGVAAFMGSMKQFADQNMNGFKPEDHSKTDAKYIFVEPRLRFRQRRIFNRYINRDADPQKTRFILSSEELATVFHIPDMAVSTPTLSRVSAKRGSAPANLPIQE